jgi:dCTP diphosphatase
MLKKLPEDAISSTVIPGDKLLNISYVTRQFREIASKKGWQVYHTPKNLAAAVAIESSELLAEFLWMTPEESASLSPEKKIQVAGEAADVAMYLCELCERLNIDLGEAVESKINVNLSRFGEE